MVCIANQLKLLTQIGVEALDTVVRSVPSVIGQVSVLHSVVPQLERTALLHIAPTIPPSRSEGRLISITQKTLIEVGENVFQRVTEIVNRLFLKVEEFGTSIASLHRLIEFPL